MPMLPASMEADAVGSGEDANATGVKYSSCPREDAL